VVAERINDSTVRRPPALLAPYVESIVGYRMLGFRPGEHVGMPSRHLTFIVSFDDPLELAVLPDGRRQTTRFDAMLGGLHTTPAVIRHDGNQHGIQLSVTPAGARALFGLPAGALASTVVPLDTVWGRLAGELLDRLDAAPPSWADRLPVIEGVLLRALRARVEIPSGARPETTEAWRRLASMDGRVEIGELAADVGWSRRHLTERFTSEYGVGPKQLARVLRFERSLGMLRRRQRPTLATVAAECGFADQAHMAREWRALAGHSPSQWLAAEELPFVQDAEPSADG
jgi:AraC-like DNA-binding protein